MAKSDDLSSFISVPVNLLIRGWSLALTDEHVAGLAGVAPSALAEWLARGSRGEPGFSELLLIKGRCLGTFAEAAATKMQRDRSWQSARAELERVGYYQPASAKAVPTDPAWTEENERAMRIAAKAGQ